jgi:hypothetical protein
VWSNFKTLTRSALRLFSYDRHIPAQLSLFLHQKKKKKKKKTRKRRGEESEKKRQWCDWSVRGRGEKKKETKKKIMKK